MRRLFPIALALYLMPFQPFAQNAFGQETAGRTFRVDDTGTSVIDSSVTMGWGATGRHSSNIVSGATQVSVQLALAPWVGRSGRIYMTLPRIAGPMVRATWTSNGVLLPGILLSGGRGLVYAGPITRPLLHDILRLNLEADGARLNGTQQLAFGFEIEVDP